MEGVLYQAIFAPFVVTSQIAAVFVGTDGRMEVGRVASIQSKRRTDGHDSYPQRKKANRIARYLMSEDFQHGLDIILLPRHDHYEALDSGSSSIAAARYFIRRKTLPQPTQSVDQKGCF